MSNQRYAISPSYQRYRRIKDLLFRQFVRLAAISVVLALVSLFVFLFWETLPLFRTATLVDQTDKVQTHDVILLPRLEQTPVKLNQDYPLVSDGSVWLHGDRSIIEPREVGLIQWIMASTNTTEFPMILARPFNHFHVENVSLLALPGSKAFISYDPTGLITLYHATTGRVLASIQSHIYPLKEIEVSVLGDLLKLTGGESNQTQWLQIDAPHAEFSWSILWRPWLYEGHQQPDFIWQTTANTDIFEPKFSFVPLSIGTFKAAFYALLFAIPLAILAAIYTACFLPESARAWIKPAVELAEAFPTVVLGFIAGMLLAPLIEMHLAMVLSLLILTPLILMLFYTLLHRLFMHLKGQSPTSSLLLMLMLLLLTLLISSGLGQQIEVFFFQGDLVEWLNQRGIDYRQRNGLVIGLVMGFAIMPVIFSLAEDALISVPESLRQGAMALGASPWQAVVKVMLPTAAAGIFAAIMIGFGRALGETMILLMASGNSPVSDFSLFEGMRSLAANLAIEAPEAMQGSTHYRVLILSATLLFMLTFLMNTLAALVRENLYHRYRRY